MLNKVTLIGNLGKDPKKIETKNNKEMSVFTLATSEGFGEKKRTEWHDVKVIGRSAEFANKHLSKGDTVCVEGKIETDKWEDDKGNNRSTKKIVAFSVLSVRGGNKKPEPQTQKEDNEGEDDLPF